MAAPYSDRDADMDSAADPASRRDAAKKARTNVMSLQFANSWWPRFFFGIVVLQAILCLGFESYIFYRFQDSIGDNVGQNNGAVVQRKTIPTFLALFIFGFLYELVLVWDALSLKNTIQIIGLCFANLAMMVYTSIQVDQIHDSLNVLSGSLTPLQIEIYGNETLKGTDASSQFPNVLKNNLSAEHYWPDISGFLIAIPCVCAIVSACMIFSAWKLYQEFAWDILKYIGADYRMKKRFLHYQIYIALLKFDFFFFLGFMIQFLVVVTNDRSDPEFGLTIAVVPITVCILLSAAVCTRREIKSGMIIVMVFYLGALSYFIFKLVRIYEHSYRKQYFPVKKSLTAFAVITIALILLTITNAFICMQNFGKGLKPHLLSPRTDPEKADNNSISMVDVKPMAANRMTID